MEAVFSARGPPSRPVDPTSRCWARTPMKATTEKRPIYTDFRVSDGLEPATAWTTTRESCQGDSRSTPLAERLVRLGLDTPSPPSWSIRVDFCWFRTQLATLGPDSEVIRTPSRETTGAAPKEASVGILDASVGPAARPQVILERARPTVALGEQVVADTERRAQLAW
jgi:hypothetical protein